MSKPHSAAALPSRFSASAFVCLALTLAACAGTESARPTTEPGTTAPTTEGEASPAPGAECGDATDCGACLAIDGCNWTGGYCSSGCAMDTYCIGPANPSAMECSHDVTILGGWQEDMASAEGGARAFVRDSVELGPARFRRSMTFIDASEDSGPVFRTNVLAPNDAHTSAEGTWSVEGDRLTVRFEPEGAAAETVERYDILEVTPTQLRLRSVEP